jgi:transposase
MPHRNAPLSELGRLRLARCVVDDKWPLRRAAERFQVSANTAKRWADRYRAEGEAGMTDRSSRPHRSPHRTPAPTERKVLHLRAKKRSGPAGSPAGSACPPRPATRCCAVRGCPG